MDLLTAERYAEKIGESLQPYCSDIQIVGSIRRRRPTPNDIDFVIVPTDLPRLMQRCRETCLVIQEGFVNLSYTTRINVRLDLYVATPRTSDLFRTVASNRGSLVLCRTGSAAHNVKMIKSAELMGMTWKPYVGLLDKAGMVIASETEEEIFEALHMPFIAPHLRECLAPVAA